MKNFKTALVLALALMVSFSAFCQDDEDAELLPSVELKNLDGETIDVAETYGENGKITVFSFWATWCGPCKKELNTLAELYEDWQEEYDLEIVAVSTDDAKSSSKVKAYVEGQMWDYDVLLDQNEDLKRALNFMTVPFTIVLDREGYVMYEHNGYKAGDEEELEEIIQELKADEEEAEDEENEEE